MYIVQEEDPRTRHRRRQDTTNMIPGHRRTTIGRRAQMTTLVRVDIQAPAMTIHDAMVLVLVLVLAQETNIHLTKLT